MNTDLLAHYEQQWQRNFTVSSVDNWLDTARKKQLDVFKSQGFPQAKDEAWKYTNLTSFKAQPYLLQVYEKQKYSNEQLQAFYLSFPHYRCVFINGYFSLELSELPVGQSELIVTNLANANHQHPDLLKTYLDQGMEQDAFANLNGACMQDGVFMHLPAEYHLAYPLHLLFISTKDSLDCMQNIRNIIVAETGARMLLIEEHISLTNVNYVTNVVTQINVDEACEIEYVKLQNQEKNSFHIATTNILQKNSSCVMAHHYSMGARLARENVNCFLNEKMATLQLQGLYLPLDQQHIDVQTAIHHRADHTASEEFFKGLIGKKSTAVFNGQIVVNENIKQVTADLQTKNLLLARDSVVNTKPELKIYSDDVKCRHGATTSQVDEEMLFYLCSRGISKETAHQLLLLAFAQENINMISHLMLAEKIKNLVIDHIGVPTHE